ncbi:MAG: phytanoyl-CoA dioxygenase family protein [Alphaproteobacteria bacterium]|nr:phytanoyl-CoA dioxygenase family protein [Alphaproteobacteria bacterium]
MPDLARFDARSVSADDVGAAIDAHGYAIVTNLLEPAAVERLRGELAPHFGATRYGETGFLGGKTKRFNNLFMRAPTTRTMATHPLLLAVADRILLRWCARYQINYTGVMHLEPGETAQALHRDAFYYPFRNPGPITTFNSIWAATDFTAANGATRIIPGSHLWDEDRQPREAEVVAADMPAGSAIFYVHALIHGGGANTTAAPRTGIGLNFSLGWLRQQENQFLTLPPELAKTLPDQLQRLIGYDFGAPFLGAVDGQSPHALLEGPDAPRGPRNDPALERDYRERIFWLKAEPVPPPPGVVPTD